MSDRQEHQRRRATALLGLAALAIWGYNAFRLAEGVMPGAIGIAPAVAEPPEGMQGGLARPRVTTPYRSDFRDPFEPPRQTNLHVARPDQETDVTGYRLLGIIGATAILQTPDDSVHVVEAGGMLGSLRIRSVDVDQVQIGAGRRTHRLLLNDGRPPNEAPSK